MKLCQGQLWKQGDEYLRIVQLERLEVSYKSLPHAASKDGTFHRVSKKVFCRLLKNAQLLPPASAPPQDGKRAAEPRPRTNSKGGQTPPPAG